MIRGFARPAGSVRPRSGPGRQAGREHVADADVEVVGVHGNLTPYAAPPAPPTPLGTPPAQRQVLDREEYDPGVLPHLRGPAAASSSAGRSAGRTGTSGAAIQSAPVAEGASAGGDVGVRSREYSPPADREGLTGRVDTEVGGVTAGFDPAAPCSAAPRRRNRPARGHWCDRRRSACPGPVGVSRRRRTGSRRRAGPPRPACRVPGPALPSPRASPDPSKADRPRP